MRIVLNTLEIRGRTVLSTASSRIQKLPHTKHGRLPAFHHVSERYLAAKDRILICQLHPSIRELLAIQDIQRLEDSRSGSKSASGGPDPAYRALCVSARKMRHWKSPQ